MRFYYENSSGDCGYFSENDLIKAIYTSWNIEANLYLLRDGLLKLDNNASFSEQCKIIFAPWEGNEFNSDVLREFGYRMVDGDIEREIVDINTGKVVKYDWSEVKQLI